MTDDKRMSPEMLREVLLKLEVNQHARSEMHLAKEDLREYLRGDLREVRSEIKEERNKLFRILSLVITLLIGSDIWALLSMKERVQHALNDEVSAIRLSVKQRLDEEFDTPRITALVEDKAREYTTKEAKHYITEQVESNLDPLRKRVTAYASEVQAQKSMLDQYQSMAEHAASNLNQQQITATLFSGALSGSRKDFEDLVQISRGNSPSALSARKGVEAVKRSLSQYSKPTFVTGGIEITISDKDGHEKLLRDFSTPDLIDALQSEKEGAEMMRYMMGYLVSKSSGQLARPALEVLRTSPSLPGVAAVCGVLISAYGEKAPFMDLEGWSRFLNVAQANPASPRPIQK